jgi:hypothetical protein
VFAAIGDPFHLDTDGGRFAFEINGTPSAVSEPPALATFGLVLIMLGISAHYRRGSALPAR